jgi:very-short-patch-repair endonuclease
MILPHSTKPPIFPVLYCRKAGESCEAFFVGDCMAKTYKTVPAGCWCFTGMKCESDLECKFWWHVKSSNAFRSGLLESQVVVGKYRVDAMATVGSYRIGIELDGKKFHDPKRDAVRDRELLKSIDGVIHIPFAAVAYYPDATMAAIGSWFPALYHYRGGWVFTRDELIECLANLEGDGDYYTEDLWLDAFDANYEVWWPLNEDTCLIGSPRAFVNGWKLQAVTLSRN